MEDIVFNLGFAQLLACVLVTLGAGVVKGMVGFAFPMIMISVLGSFLTPDVALAALILPTFVSNALQGFRDGRARAVQAARKYRVFLIAAGVMLVISAQLFVILPMWVLFLAIGLPVTLFCLMQLLGAGFHLARQHRGIEMAMGVFAGLIGGLSGVWGPPMVAYLTALNTEKREQMRAQGVTFMLGSVLLLAAHGVSGVVTWATLTLSAWLVVPAVIGMWIGMRIQDRIDQRAFRRATLIVLLVAGLNLIRRALLG